MADTSTRRRFLTVVGAGTAASIAGCTGDDQEGASGGDSDTGDGGDSTTQSDQSGGTLRLAVTEKINSLDVVIKGTGGVDQWGESLMDYDNGVLPPEPGLAEDVETIDNGKRYRFTLREGVTFHDGSELTASDVVYSWERIAQSDNSENADDIIGGTFTAEHEKEGDDPELEDYVPGSLQVEAVDDRTVELTMRRPYFGALFQIASESTFVIIPENTVGDIEREDIETDGEYSYQEAFGTENDGPKVTGTGPFEVDEWSKGDRLELTRYDDYWGETADIDGVSITILSGAEAAYQRALNGNLDIFEVPANKFSADRQQNLESIGEGRRVGEFELENGTVVNHSQANALGSDSIIFNANKVPIEVRRAMALMLNLENVAQDLYANQQPAYHYVPPQMFPNVDGKHDSPADAYEAHLNGEDIQLSSEASELVQDGYPWGMGEARMSEAQQLIEDADLVGESYTMTLSQETNWQRVGERIQSKANSIGLEIELETSDYGTIISKGVFDQALDFYSLGDTAEVPAPDNLLRFYPPQTAYQQASQWGDLTSEDADPTNPDSWETRVQKETAEAWEENYVQAQAPGDEFEQRRNKAYLTVEEAIWHSAQIIPTAHRVTREFWSDEVDYTPPGVMGGKTYNDVTIDRDG